MCLGMCDECISSSTIIKENENTKKTKKKRNSFSSIASSASDHNKAGNKVVEREDFTFMLGEENIPDEPSLEFEFQEENEDEEEYAIFTRNSFSMESFEYSVEVILDFFLFLSKRFISIHIFNLKKILSRKILSSFLLFVLSSKFETSYCL